MNNRPIEFDDARLTELKNRHCGYVFCPRCRSTLEEALIDGVSRMACPDKSCGFVFYQNPIPAAGCVLVRDEQILLVKRGHPPKIGWWCFPAGFMEWGEHPEETAVREVREETGLRVRVTQFFEVYAGTDDPRVNAILMLYLADIIGGDLEAGDDAQDARFFSLNKLPEKIAFESHHRALADYNRRFRS